MQGFKINVLCKLSASEYELNIGILHLHVTKCLKSYMTSNEEARVERSFLFLHLVNIHMCLICRKIQQQLLVLTNNHIIIELIFVSLFANSLAVSQRILTKSGTEVRCGYESVVS